MHRLLLLGRLIVRALLLEPWRSLLTVACVSVGVAVIIAIDLAGEAAAGSFRSSMESLQGDASLEISQLGGIPETALGDLARLEAPLRFSARVEGFVTVLANGERVPLFGVDLLGDETLESAVTLEAADLTTLREGRPAWVSNGMGLAPGRQFQIAVNDRVETLFMQGLLADAGGSGGLRTRMIVVDVALAQSLLDREGTVDRIYVHSEADAAEQWRPRIEALLPPAAQVSAAGSRSREYRRLLNSFRWNLRIISYIALIVGAFLIYNSVSVRVVRRRPLIGVARAIGMTSAMVRAGFLFEGLVFGLLGTLLGLVLGRVLAVGAVALMGRTVESLYASAAPPELAVRPETIALAVCAGLGVSLLSAVVAGPPSRQRSSDRSHGEGRHRA